MPSTLERRFALRSSWQGVNHDDFPAGLERGMKFAKQQRGRVKYASAHDLRRRFGFRWSQRVMPPVLQQMMRHESIQTTMEFYVGKNSEAAAEAIGSALANTSANTAPDSAATHTEAHPATCEESMSSKRKAWDSNPHPRKGARISSAARPTVSGYLPGEALDCRL